MVRIRRDSTIIQAFIKNAIIAGLSANKALERLKELGLGIRRSVFLRMYREARGIEEKTKLLKFVRNDRVPSERLFTKTTMNLRNQYAYVYKITLKDSVTGKERVRYAGYSTPIVHKMGTIKEIGLRLARKIGMELYKEYDLDNIQEIEKVEVDKIYVRSSEFDFLREGIE